MKNKAPLALMELVIMVLIFSMAAAVCLQAFVWSARESEEMALRDAAMLQVQNGAEVLKASGGDLSLIASGNPEVILSAKYVETGLDGLGGAMVSAEDEEGNELFSVKVYWQEPLKGGRYD